MSRALAGGTVNAARRDSERRKREVAIAAVRDEALVVLDAVVEQRDVESLFPGRLPALLGLALAGYRLRWPPSRAVTPWKWHDRTTGRTMFLAKRVDAYCRFCGEALMFNVERSSRPNLTGGGRVGDLRDARVRDADVRLARHTIICALQCLAGLREYASPDTRKLPSDATEVAGG